MAMKNVITVIIKQNIINNPYSKNGNMFLLQAMKLIFIDSRGLSPANTTSAGANQ